MKGSFTTRPILLTLALASATLTFAQSRVDPGVPSPVKATNTARHAGIRPHAPVSQFTIHPSDLGSRGGSYCAAGADGTGLGLDERIINVSFAGINNTTTNAPPVAPAYWDFTGFTANVVAGMSFPISVGVSSNLAGGTSYGENQVLVWIDYNQDGDFSDANELAFTSLIEATTAYTGSITIPASAPAGTTRMRVRMHDTHDGTNYENIFNNTPCGNASYGEVEDYSVTVSNGGGVPANDLCSGAVTQALAIGGSVTFFGNNTGALDTEGLDAASVWESFSISQCAFVTVSYCGTASVFENYFLGISGSCPLDEGVAAVSNNPDDCFDGNGTIYFEFLPAGTYYYPVLSEPGSVGPYTLTVSASACPGGYCGASADECDEYIANVQFAGINNSSACVVGPAVDYTGFVANVTQGTNVALTVTNGPNVYPEDQVAVWIDWNQNQSFTDAGEGFLLPTADEGVTFGGLIPVPATATLGATRMRIRMMYTGTPSPCGSSEYGEVEDYTVVVSSGGGPTPPNDLCGNVIPALLSVGGSVNFTGNNTNATSTGDAAPGSELDPIDPTVWHAFTTSECSNVTVSYCGTNPNFTNVWVFLTNSCPANTFVIGSANFEFCADNAVITFFDLPAGTWYLPVLLDPVNAIGPYTIQVSATACGSSGDYCTAGASSTQFEKISNVTFSDMSNNSTSAAGFEDFTSETASVVAGLTYSMSVSIAAGYDTDQVLAWIDWDQNSTFDAGELVFASTNGVGPHSGNITVPLTAELGTTRMRVRLHDTYVGVDYFNSPNTTPCDTSTFGQVEDYTIDVTGIITGTEEVSAVNWSVFPNPSNGDFVIRYQGAEDRMNIEVLDMTGRLVFSDRQAASTGSTIHLAMAGKLAAGTYVLRVSTEAQTREQRIVIR